MRYWSSSAVLVDGVFVIKYEIPKLLMLKHSYVYYISKTSKSRYLRLWIKEINLLFKVDNGNRLCYTEEKEKK